MEEKIMKNLVKKMNSKMIAASALIAATMPSNVYAKGANLDTAVKPIVALINSLMGPALALVGALGSLYCVLLGVKGFTFHMFLAGALLNAIPGIVLQLILIPAIMLLLHRKEKKDATD